ncbi:alpha/beta-hydrolase [Exidia glandulosa HHB12029]|uniref:Dipeptidyl-peptidase V n=1 Tax=Exidia glandulosa HHB12029 TaxID=1314781 RepID=A0A165KXJ4_EXIGL|nr:alpha/beta-hydrolase [Exidia glandulosa HHB12029]
MQLPTPMSLAVTPEAIATSDQLLQPVISPDGAKVLYRVKPLYKAADKEHWTSALWVADVDKAGSARQLTSGLFNDYNAVFSHDSQSLFFLSDRHKAGGKAQIYTLPLTVGGEATPLTNVDLKKGVSSFRLSPDGRYIVYTSADEPSAADEDKEKRKDDAIVFSDKKNLAKLRLLRIATRTTVTFNLPSDWHALSFAWSPDSEQLVVCMSQSARLEHMEVPGRYYTVSLREPNAAPNLLMTHLNANGGDLTWLADGTLLEVRYHNPHTVIAAHSVAKLVPTENASQPLYCGVDNDAEGIFDLRHDSLFAVPVATGLNTRVDIVDSSGARVGSLYETNDEALGSLDVKRLNDGSYVFACLRSSGPSKEAWNVWAGRTSSATSAVELTKLSAHHSWAEEAEWQTKTEAFTWSARDGTKLEGLISKPTDAGKGPYPTVLIVHGGPYSRDVPALNLSFASWHAFLSGAGFCTISPNYRGSSGRGSAFAETMRGGVGTVDWTDCEDMVDAAIARGIADPKRLGIGGWSQGGFMTAWGVAQSKNKFKAGCMGAGVSDWGSMSEESDMPEFETELGGYAPWSPSQGRTRGDAINHVKDVETAVLILHGEKDERVPVGQAIGYFRGLRREGKHPERCELVIYPREPHGFTERTHAEDVLKRVLDHFTTWLT